MQEKTGSRQSDTNSHRDGLVYYYLPLMLLRIRIMAMPYSFLLLALDKIFTNVLFLK